MKLKTDGDRRARSRPAQRPAQQTAVAQAITRPGETQPKHVDRRFSAGLFGSKISFFSFDLVFVNLVLIVLLVGVLSAIYFLPNGLARIDEQEKSIAELQSEISRREEIILELENQNKLLREDPEVLEKYARNELGLIKDDEVFVQVVGSANN